MKITEAKIKNLSTSAAKREKPPSLKVKKPRKSRKQKVQSLKPMPAYKRLIYMKLLL